MHLEVKCPGCGYSLLLSTNDIGSRVACSRCDSSFTVPRSGESPSDVVLSDRVQATMERSAVASAIEPVDRGIRIVCTLYILLACLKGFLFLLLAGSYFSLPGMSLYQINETVWSEFGVPFRATGSSVRLLESMLGKTALFTGFEVVCFSLISRWLRMRIRFSLCFLIAILACITIPLGTALGLVTIVLLQDAEIRRGFPGMR